LGMDPLMSDHASVSVLSVEYAVATRPLPGETESGDHYVVVPTTYGTLIAVVDGVGHGAEASQAALTAAETIRSNAEESIISLVSLCHQRLRSTRGAVMSLASFHDHDSTMTWLGVGNVEGILLRAPKGTGMPDEAILKRGGLVGYHLPPLKALVLPILAGDTLIFATDGIHPGFTQNLWRSATPQQIADSICSKHSTFADDALALVARYIGRSA
jgi:phosphoserine phosphatase RsbX